MQKGTNNNWINFRRFLEPFEDQYFLLKSVLLSCVRIFGQCITENEIVSEIRAEKIWSTERGRWFWIHLIFMKKIDNFIQFQSERWAIRSWVNVYEFTAGAFCCAWELIRFERLEVWNLFSGKKIIENDSLLYFEFYNFPIKL